MSKVLVEAPRSGRSWARASTGTRRLARNAFDANGECAPSRISMRRDATKHFGEHLGPLYRWLRGQVGRPWRKVYGELCAALDRRSVVQAHLFQHIEDKVAIETLWLDDAVWVRGRLRTAALADYYTEMFVHPRTGILLVNRAREQAARRRKAERVARARERAAERHLAPPGRPADRQWHRVDGVWFEVTLRALEAGAPNAYDQLLRRTVSERDADALRQRYGSSTRYACAKRQLDSRTLRRNELAHAPYPAPCASASASGQSAGK